MELARMTVKGQLTVPVAIRRMLGLDAGDQVLFYEKNGQIIISGATPSALQEAQIAAAENHVYTLDEIRKIAVPIIKSHKAAGLRLFGSYARGEATKESDIDFIINRGEVKTMFLLGGLQSELADAFHKKIDILTDDSLDPAFRSAIGTDEVTLYDIRNT